MVEVQVGCISVSVAIPTVVVVVVVVVVVIVVVAVRFVIVVVLFGMVWHRWIFCSIGDIEVFRRTRGLFVIVAVAVATVTIATVIYSFESPWSIVGIASILRNTQGHARSTKRIIRKEVNDGSPPVVNVDFL
jgi:hypothetical protein